MSYHARKLRVLGTREDDLPTKVKPDPDAPSSPVSQPDSSVQASSSADPSDHDTSLPPPQPTRPQQQHLPSSTPPITNASIYAASNLPSGSVVAIAYDPRYGLHLLPPHDDLTPPPGVTVNRMIKNVLLGSPDNKATSSEIAVAIMNKYPYYRQLKEREHLKNTLRHHLSREKCFQLGAKRPGATGKARLWTYSEAGALETSASPGRDRRKGGRLPHQPELESASRFINNRLPNPAESSSTSTFINMGPGPTTMEPNPLGMGPGGGVRPPIGLPQLPPLNIPPALVPAFRNGGSGHSTMVPPEVNTTLGPIRSKRGRPPRHEPRASSREHIPVPPMTVSHPVLPSMTRRIKYESEDDMSDGPESEEDQLDPESEDNS